MAVCSENRRYSLLACLTTKQKDPFWRDISVPSRAANWLYIFETIYCFVIELGKCYILISFAGCIARYLPAMSKVSSSTDSARQESTISLVYFEQRSPSGGYIIYLSQGCGESKFVSIEGDREGQAWPWRWELRTASSSWTERFHNIKVQTASIYLLAQWEESKVTENETSYLS